MLKKIAKITRFNQNAGNSNVPAGQYVTNKFPVLTFGSTPKIDLETWRFRVFGLVEKELCFDWDQFTSIGRVTLDAEFHCVTQWSRLKNTWEGVPFLDLMKLVKLKPEAQYIMIHCYGGYTANLTQEVLSDTDVLFAYRHDGEPLDPDHGGPMRIVVPKRYGWKSAKWVNGLEFMAENAAGYWEARGYHMNGDPWKEERFSEG